MKINSTKMKKRFTIIAVVLVIMTLLNFIFANFPEVQATDANQSVTEVQEDETDSFFNSAIDGFAGILLYPLKLVPLLIGKVLSMLMNGLSGENITIFNVLFNKVNLTGINFFETATGNNSGTINAIRENVAVWYVSLRNLAAMVLTLILIYVAIRMAISTVAEDKAKYKNMLIDWLTSLCLLFVLHYIMIIVININNALVNVLTPSGAEDNLASIGAELASNAVFTISFAQGVGNAIAYMMLVGMSFIYFFAYVKRMITIAFLIIISPLITITYSIDKMGDGKSQALNTWLKEFIYNILIQPFQCVIYLSLVSTILNLITVGNVNLVEVFIAIYVLMFMYQAEEIVKNIFGFQSKSMGQTIASAAITGALISRGTSLFKGKDKKKKRGEPSSTNNRPRLKDNTGGGSPSPAGGPPPSGAGGSVTPPSESDAPVSGSGTPPSGPRPMPTGGSGSTSSRSTSRRSGSGKSSNKFISGAKSIGKGALKYAGKAEIMAAKAGLNLAGVALGLSTGKLETGIAGYSLGDAQRGLVNKGIESYQDSKAQEERNCAIANSIDDYQAKYGMTNTQVLQRTQDWLDGISMPDEDDVEGLELYRRLTDEKEIQKDNGISEDDARDMIDTLIQDSLSGKQSRVSENIVDRIRNRLTNNSNNS